MSVATGLGVVVRRYIDSLILLVPTPLASVLFYSSIATFCSFYKCFSFFYILCAINVFESILHTI